MVEYEHCNTAPFWQEYKDNKEGAVSLELTDEGKKWQEENQ
jgi:hypothetical protein